MLKLAHDLPFVFFGMINRINESANNMPQHLRGDRVIQICTIENYVQLEYSSTKPPTTKSLIPC